MKHARSSYKSGIYTDSEFFVDASSGVLGKEDWALAVRDVRVRGTGRQWQYVGGGGEEMKKLQRERESKNSLKSIADGSVDQQHRTMFCALKYARSSNIATNFDGQRFFC